MQKSGARCLGSVGSPTPCRHLCQGGVGAGAQPHCEPFRIHLQRLWLPWHQPLFCPKRLTQQHLQAPQMLQNPQRTPSAAALLRWSCSRSQETRGPILLLSQRSTPSCLPNHRLGCLCPPASPGGPCGDETPSREAPRGSDTHLHCAPGPAAASSHSDAEDAQRVPTGQRPPPRPAHELRTKLTFLGKNLTPLIPPGLQSCPARAPKRAQPWGSRRE